MHKPVDAQLAEALHTHKVQIAYMRIGHTTNALLAVNMKILDGQVKEDTGIVAQYKAVNTTAFFVLE